MADGETTWFVPVPFNQGTNCRLLSAWKFLLPEERGGVFYLQVCNDSMYYVGSNGILTRVRFPGTSNPALSPNTIGVFSDSRGGMVWADVGGIAQRYDSLGTALWGNTPIVYRSDPQNAHFSSYWGDNNGGIIGTFWSTSRGLCAQHTGRYGLPGIVPVDQPPGLPTEFTLSQNFPNPFNPNTRIEFQIAHSAEVTLKVFDLLGQEVAVLVVEHLFAGTYSTDWNATNLASGVYYYQLRSGDFVQTKKLVILR